MPNTPVSGIRINHHKFFITNSYAFQPFRIALVQTIFQNLLRPVFDNLIADFYSFLPSKAVNFCRFRRIPLLWISLYPPYIHSPGCRTAPALTIFKSIYTKHWIKWLPRHRNRPFIVCLDPAGSGIPCWVATSFVFFCPLLTSQASKFSLYRWEWMTSGEKSATNF